MLTPCYFNKTPLHSHSRSLNSWELWSNVLHVLLASYLSGPVPPSIRKSSWYHARLVWLEQHVSANQSPDEILSRAVPLQCSLLPQSRAVPLTLPSKVRLAWWSGAGFRWSPTIIWLLHVRLARVVALCWELSTVRAECSKSGLKHRFEQLCWARRAGKSVCRRLSAGKAMFCHKSCQLSCRNPDPS